ncbi:hypothetical protein ACWGK1_22255 [Streptomyces wedmorensis]
MPAADEQARVSRRVPAHHRHRTITGPARCIPDAADPKTGVAVSALHIEKTPTIRCGKHRIRPAHHW